jgi:hypothetical protein
MPTTQEWLPPYKVAKYATRDKFLDLVDNSPPFLAAEIYPGPDDHKSQKLTFTFTSAPANGPHTFFRHNINIANALALFRKMSQGIPGDPARQGSLPGFPEFKGFRSNREKTGWEYESHILDVRYITDVQGTPLRQGPSYGLSFTVGEGRARMMAGKPGIVMPANNGTDKSATVLLPIYGNKDNPPSAVLFAEACLSYIQAREVERLAIMRQCMQNLRFYAQTDSNARIKLESILQSLRGKMNSPQEIQGVGYNNLAEAQDAYNAQANAPAVDPQLQQQAHEQGYALQNGTSV